MFNLRGDRICGAPENLEVSAPQRASETPLIYLVCRAHPCRAFVSARCTVLTPNYGYLRRSGECSSTSQTRTSLFGGGTCSGNRMSASEPYLDVKGPNCSIACCIAPFEKPTVARYVRWYECVCECSSLWVAASLRFGKDRGVVREALEQISPCDYRDFEVDGRHPGPTSR